MEIIGRDRVKRNRHGGLAASSFPRKSQREHQVVTRATRVAWLAYKRLQGKPHHTKPGAINPN